MNTIEEINDRQHKISDLRKAQAVIDNWLMSNFGHEDWLCKHNEYCTISVKITAHRHRIARLKSKGDHFGLEEVHVPRNLMKARS